MGQKSSAVIVIPAFNEGGKDSPLLRTIQLIRQTKLPVEICIVNDGSTDNTSGIAKQEGCIVVDLPKHLGKNFAYLAGIKRALAENPLAIVSLDADMKAVPRFGMEQLIDTATRASGQKKILMARANVSELIDPKKPWVSITLGEISGIRSFSVPAARKLLSSKHKSLASGYGLEYFLEQFFEDSKCIIENTQFVQDKAYRQQGRREIQYQEIDRTRKRLETLKVAELKRFFSTGPKTKNRRKK